MILQQLLNKAQAPYHEFKAICNLAFMFLDLSLILLGPQGPTKHKNYAKVTHPIQFP
jgi:hypothetical protein